jgi:cyclic pyranopterin phosphate synthase
MDMIQKKSSHLDAEGQLKMVDVGEKKVTQRTARAAALLIATPETVEAIWSHQLPKGDALTTAKIAGIQAAKQTSHLIPMCHTLLLDMVDLSFERTSEGIQIQSEVRLSGKTGAEMEALSAVTVAALTLYDMAKSVQKDMIITNARLVFKDGGKSGTYQHA